jgi:hypothetical protein
MASVSVATFGPAACKGEAKKGAASRARAMDKAMRAAKRGAERGRPGRGQVGGRRFRGSLDFLGPGRDVSNWGLSAASDFSGRGIDLLAVGHSDEARGEGFLRAAALTILEDLEDLAALAIAGRDGGKEPPSPEPPGGPEGFGIEGFGPEGFGL